MTSSKAELAATLDDRLTKIAWRQWAAFGVPGWEEQEPSVEIDPEGLLLLTAALPEPAARLRGEAIGWCVRYGWLISKVRLKNAASRLATPAKGAFLDLAEQVAAEGGPRWTSDPSSSAAVRRTTPGRVRLEHLSSPSRLALRLRAVLGVSARAEVVRLLVRQPEAWLTISELAPGVGSGRRNTADAAEALALGGLLRRRLEKNAWRYTADMKRLAPIVEPLPDDRRDWAAAAQVLLEVRALLTGTPAPVDVLAVEARALIQRLEPDLHRAGLEPPDPLPRGSGYWASFGDWLTATTSALAGPRR